MIAYSSWRLSPIAYYTFHEISGARATFFKSTLLYEESHWEKIDYTIDCTFNCANRLNCDIKKERCMHIALRQIAISYELISYYWSASTLTTYFWQVNLLKWIILSFCSNNLYFFFFFTKTLLGTANSLYIKYFAYTRTIDINNEHDCHSSTAECSHIRTNCRKLSLS